MKQSGGSLSCHFAGQNLANRRLTSGRKTSARSRNSKVSLLNIVVIAWNDMDFSGINCGGSEIETRNRDRLTAGGTHFVNFHCNTQRRRNSCFTDGRTLAPTTAKPSRRGLRQPCRSHSACGLPHIAEQQREPCINTFPTSLRTTFRISHCYRQFFHRN